MWSARSDPTWIMVLLIDGAEWAGTGPPFSVTAPHTGEVVAYLSAGPEQVARRPGAKIATRPSSRTTGSPSETIFFARTAPRPSWTLWWVDTHPFGL